MIPDVGFRLEREPREVETDPLDLGLVPFVEIRHVHVGPELVPGRLEDVFVASPVQLQLPFLRVLLEYLVNLLERVTFVYRETHRHG